VKFNFDIIAELHRSVSQQTLATIELPLTYWNWQENQRYFRVNREKKILLEHCIDLLHNLVLHQ